VDDGLLTASEVTQLELDADWVIMSACRTAAGKVDESEALSGLAHDFFYAARPLGRSDVLAAFLNWFLSDVVPPPHRVVAAGHAATYALYETVHRPGTIDRLPPLVRACSKVQEGRLAVRSGHRGGRRSSGAAGLDVLVCRGRVSFGHVIEGIRQTP
jgi:hypothetical protein